MDREKQLPASKKVRCSLFPAVISLVQWNANVSSQHMRLRYDATEKETWDGRCDAREFGSVGQDYTGVWCVTLLCFREGGVPKPRRVFWSLLTDPRLFSLEEGKLAAARFIQSRGVVMNDEIPHFHLIPVVWASDYLWPNLTTEKFPKFSNREKPSTVLSLKILQRVDVTPTLRMWETICLNSRHVTWGMDDKGMVWHKKGASFHHFSSLTIQNVQTRALRLSWVQPSAGGGNGHGAGCTWRRTTFRGG